MSPETKQLLMFLLGQEMGRTIEDFKEKKISKEAYDILCHNIETATSEVLS
jgi:hypothetical protein